MSVSFSNIVLTPGSATLTTKGDILTHDGTNPARLAIGADGTFLQAQSSASLGLSWRTTALGPNGDLRFISSSTITANTTTVSFSGMTSFDAAVIFGYARCSADSAELIVKTANADYSMAINLTSGTAPSGNITPVYDNARTATTQEFKILGSSASSNTSSTFGYFHLLLKGGPSPLYFSEFHSVGFVSGNKIAMTKSVSGGSSGGTVSLYHTTGSFVSGSKFFVYGLDLS